MPKFAVWAVETTRIGYRIVVDAPTQEIAEAAVYHEMMNVRGLVLDDLDQDVLSVELDVTPSSFPAEQHAIADLGPGAPIA